MDQLNNFKLFYSTSIALKKQHTDLEQTRENNNVMNSKDDEKRMKRQVGVIFFFDSEGGF